MSETLQGHRTKLDKTKQTCITRPLYTPVGLRLLTLYGNIKTAERRTIIQQYGD